MEGFFFASMFIVGCLATGSIIGTLIGKVFVFVLSWVTEPKEQGDE